MPEIKNIKILTYLYCQGQENSVQRTLHMHMTCTSIKFVLEVILKRLCLEHMVSNILKYTEK